MNDEIHKDHVQWLKNNISPMPEVIEKWELTTNYRIRQFSNLPIDSYLRSFPALREPLGYKLFALDFTVLFPGKENSLFTKWPVTFPKILKFAESKKDSSLKFIFDEYHNNKIDNATGNFNDAL